MAAIQFGGFRVDTTPPAPSIQFGGFRADGAEPPVAASIQFGGFRANGQVSLSVLPLSPLTSPPGVRVAVVAQLTPGLSPADYYEWAQDSGPNLKLTSDGSNTAYITVPSVHPSASVFSSVLHVIAHRGAQSSTVRTMTVTALPETRFIRSGGAWVGRSQPPPA